jgi:hypothetical protein
MAQDIIVETLGNDNPEHFGGIVHTNVLFAPLDWFDVIGQPKALHDASDTNNEATTFAELSTISTDHTFKTGKGFMVLTTAIETSDIKSTYLGESTNKIVENKALIVLEDSKPEILGFSRWAKNKRGILLLQEAGSKQYRQLGSAEHGAIFTELDAMVEALRDGLNRRTITVSDKSRYEAPIYTGTITKVPEV